MIAPPESAGAGWPGPASLVMASLGSSSLPVTAGTAPLPASARAINLGRL